MINTQSSIENIEINIFFFFFENIVESLYTGMYRLLHNVVEYKKYVGYTRSVHLILGTKAKKKEKYKKICGK